ncbi:hydroxyethylthiazole kinase [Clostridium sp.]|uniref:hydroxyethylthiazole kinase n=1 Tax=Clostridium sp. TaxID=1506 RepID=UPI0025BE471A|nr:hydroxyethylthiazole kinase [Clostridium sp.]
MQIGIRALDENLSLQKKKHPLIHCISNSVAAKDLAQGILCYNGSPVIANSTEEAPDITSKCDCLLINLENLSGAMVETMEKAIRVARRKGIPIVLDITGVNFSFFRKEIALRFINRYNINVVKGKLEEFKVLIQSDDKLKSNDFTLSKVKENIEVRVSLRSFSKRYNIIVVVQCEDYYLTDGFSEFYLEGEQERFNNIFGIEIILCGLISVGVASASNNEQIFRGVLVAIMTIAVSERIVVQKNLKPEKSIWLKEYLLDEIEKIDAEKLNRLAKVEYSFVR